MLCKSLNIKKITGKTPLDAKQALQSLLLFTVVSSVIFNFIDVIWARIIIALLTVAYLLYMLNDTKMLLCERS